MPKKKIVYNPDQVSFISIENPWDLITQVSLEGAAAAVRNRTEQEVNSSEDFTEEPDPIEESIRAFEIENDAAEAETTEDLLAALDADTAYFDHLASLGVSELPPENKSSPEYGKWLEERSKEGTANAINTFLKTHRR